MVITNPSVAVILMMIGIYGLIFARMLAGQPQAMQLRFLQTLSSIASDKSNTIVFPVPVDMITPIMEGLDKLRRSQERS